mgnify:CR=1 FL=1
MNKKVNLMIIIIFISFIFVGCSTTKENDIMSNNNKINIVTTIFPTYDFVRQIGGENVNVTMLLKPGEESHSYEPTPKDILNIQNSDLFIYVGGENDFWVDEILNSMGNNKPQTLKLLDITNTLEEEIVEGMEDNHDHSHEDDHNHDHDHRHEDEVSIDEHVWTSPKNSILIVKEINKILSEKDEKNSNMYNVNAENYIKSLENLDQEFRQVVNNSKRKTILFGDRFPFIYFAKEYGIDYYAAFSGCSTETEASPKTITFLINKVKEEQIPVVFTIEFSNGKIADTIVEATNTKKMMLNSGHNLTKEQLESGVTFLSLMKENVDILREALN